MAKEPHFQTGDRVRYVKSQIDDVPRDTEGTVVGYTRPDGKTVIVKFDYAAGNRYMPKSHIKLALPAPPPSCQEGCDL